MPAPLVFHLFRFPDHSAARPSWVAECGINGRRYTVRSTTGPVCDLARRLAEAGVPDAAVSVRWGLSGPEAGYHPSFRWLARGSEAPAGARRTR